MVGKVNSLSDEAFNVLLERLEVSVVRLSELERTWRIDTEFYGKENLKIDSLIKNLSPLPLTDYVDVSDGNHMKISHRFSDKGVPYYRGQDVHHFFIEQSNPYLIEEAAYFERYMYRSHIKKGDVLLSIVGTIGKLSLVNKEFKATCSCKLAILRPKLIKATFLAAFLSSKYGQNQIQKFTRGAVQKGLILEDMNQLYIPKFLTHFQNEIDQIINQAYEALETSKNLYTTAEVELLTALGLSDYQPSTENVQVKSLKDSFLSSGRLDAEYFQPKYEEVEVLIKNYIGGWDYLGNQIETINTGEYSSYYLQKSENLKFFIRNTNIKNGFVEEAATHFVNPNDFKKFAKTGDILTARVGAIGTFGTITKEFDGCVYSDNVLKIRFPKNFLPEVYTMYFNSAPNQELMEKIAGGSVQPLVTQTTLKQIIIPIFEEELQSNVSNAIQRSFKLKTQSKQLLHIAKTGVEKAIETSEAEAMAWMETALAEIN